jgi:Zinc-finger of C2H2 type
MSGKERIKCDICGKSFYSKKQLEQHTKDTHSTVDKRKPVKKPFKLTNKFIRLIGVGVLVAIIAAIGIYYAMTPHTSLPVAAGSTIDGIGCNSMEQFAMHIHAHLDIIINGVYFLVPSQIGIPSSCFYWLHTHDESGIIHIEAPMHRDFTLGQFFDIWGKKLSNDQIFNYVANANNPLNVYVNGTKVPGGTNYRDIKLNAHDEIAIVYGTPPSTIPSSYKFPQGL